MRIVGGKDYYDRALSHGSDDRLIFVRQPDRLISDADIECPIGSLRLMLTDGKRYLRHVNLGDHYESFEYGDHAYNVARTVVIFCGKVYRGIAATSFWVPGAVAETTGEPIRHYFWQADKLREWLSSVGLSINDSKTFIKRAGRTLHGEEFRLRDLESLFAVEPASSRLLEWLTTNRAVIAIRFPRSHRLEAAVWAINSDRLGEIGFFRVMNAFEAFQEISMWVGGVLPDDANPMAAIDDRTRIAKHGFDQTSFRRAKSKKR